VRQTPKLPKDTLKAPRFFGMLEYPLAGATHRRAAASYPVWMLQRLLHAQQCLSKTEQQQQSDWLSCVAGTALLRLNLPTVKRVALSAAHIG
jgi:hypothetical protein